MQRFTNNMNYVFNAKFTAYVLLIFSLFVSLDGFGLRQEAWGGLGFSDIGVWGSLQLTLALASFITTILYSQALFISGEYRYIVMMLFLAIFCSLATSYIECFDGNAAFSDVHKNLFQVRNILLLPVFFWIGKKINNPWEYFSIIAYCGAVSMVVAIFMVLSGYESSVAHYSFTNNVGSEFRYILPTGNLIAFGYFFYLARALKLGGSQNSIIAVILFLGVALQMHRSVLISLLIASVALLVATSRNTFRSLTRLATILLVVLFIALLTSDFFGYTIEMWFANINQLISELSEVKGNSSLRILLILNTITYVFENGLIFGVGFNWVDYDLDDYMSAAFALRPSVDSTYSSVIIVYGIFGIFIFSILFFKMIKTFYSLQKDTQPMLASCALAGFGLLIYLILCGMASDNIIRYSGNTIFYCLVAISILLSDDATVK